MDASFIDVSYPKVALAASLIIINGAVSMLLKLHLEWRLLWASLRMTVQLLLVGFVLRWVFALHQWYYVVPLLAIMALIAGIAAVQRTERRYGGVWLDSIASVGVSSCLMASVALFVVLQVKPWYSPQYAIPIFGMILGNSLSGISLGLERLGQELGSARDQVEARLALGASRWEAARSAVARAVRTGMIPTLNVMVIAGIVSLPGMMTGQLLAGVDPVKAVKYQIVILFLLASGTALGTVGVTLLAYRRLFNGRHQFCHWKLREAPASKRDQ